MITYIIFLVVGSFVTVLLAHFLRYFGALIGCSGLLGWAIVGALGLLVKVDFIIAHAFMSWGGASVAALLVLHFIPSAHAFIAFLGNRQKTTHGTAEFSGKKTKEKYAAGEGVALGLTESAITASQYVPPHKVLFIYNEFAQLGYMSRVEDGITILRGAGGQIWIVVQELSQLKGVYKKWQAFLPSTTRQFFGCSDLDTAKYISESLGQYTETVSKHDTGGQADSFIARNLLNPDEVVRLPKTAVLAFAQGEAPVRLKRMTYYEDKEYQGKFDKNPYVS